MTECLNPFLILLKASLCLLPISLNVSKSDLEVVDFIVFKTFG